VNRKYPLETLRRARTDEVDRRTHAYADAIGREEAARADLGQKVVAHRALESRIESQVSGERARLEQGELSALDLARGAVFGLRCEIEKRASAQAVDKARVRHETEIADAHAKRGALGRASADAEVVERNRAAWLREGQKAAERAEETAVEEAHAALAARKGKR
jgi:hypothetical protein